MNISLPKLLRDSKAKGRKLAMVSLYDAPSAAIACDAGVDLLLVGDSLGNVILGYDSPLRVTIEDMLHHSEAVSRGVSKSSRPEVPVVSDMPFGSYTTIPLAAANGADLVRAGAHAVKLEGAGVAALAAVGALVEMGVPAVGHLGFTPQSSLRFESVVQGKNREDAERLLEDAKALEDAGCCAIVLEVVPGEVAQRITEKLSICTIGIGAGLHCDVQVLVWHDLVGLTQHPPLRFVKRYTDAYGLLKKATEEFVSDIRSIAFPSPEHGWQMNRAESAEWESQENSDARGSDDGEQVKNARDCESMPVTRSPEEMRSLSEHWRADSQKIGFVPTMGALHEGHLSLVRRAREENEKLIVSVFVNPTQFGSGEDFDTYPRKLGRDRELLAEAGCDALFAPAIGAMYGGGFPDLLSGERTFVEVGSLGEMWEGEERPGHFRGVATVVAMLFHAVVPHRAYFGEKDYQQLKIIQNMARELLFGVEILGCPTVREADGLAMSSRNAYLSGEEREAATTLYRALEAAAELARSGEQAAAKLVERMREVCTTESLVKLQYAAVVDPETLVPLERLNGRLGRALIAAYVGSTHLIDNLELPDLRDHRDS